MFQASSSHAHSSISSLPSHGPGCDRHTALVVGSLECRNLADSEPRISPRRLKRAGRPGDVFVMEDGDWPDAVIDLPAEGSARNPVILRARTPGKVHLTGKSRVRISGRFVVVDGLAFENPRPDDDVFAFRTDSKHLASDCVLRNCSIQDSSEVDREALVAVGVDLWNAESRRKLLVLRKAGCRRHADRVGDGRTRRTRHSPKLVRSAEAAGKKRRRNDSCRNQRRVTPRLPHDRRGELLRGVRR